MAETTIFQYVQPSPKRWGIRKGRQDRRDEKKKTNKKNSPPVPHLLQAQQAPALPYAKAVGRPGTGSYPAPSPDPSCLMWVQTIWQKNSLIWVCSVCQFFCILCMPYSMVKPDYSNFKIVTAIIQNVPIFRIITILTTLKDGWVQQGTIRCINIYVWVIHRISSGKGIQQYTTGFGWIGTWPWRNCVTDNVKVTDQLALATKRIASKVTENR